MDVLVVRKTTNYEIHGDAVKESAALGAVPQEALARLKKAHDEHYSTVNTLRTLLNERGLEFMEISRDDDIPADHRGVVVTVGGDGTLLSAGRKIHDNVILGVKSSISSVGYLCAADEDSLADWVDKIAAGELKTTPFTRMSAEISKRGGSEQFKTAPVLNDFLFANSYPAALSRYLLRFKGRVEAQRSSGLWIATGTGSTAAILAAGGSQRPVTETQIQFRVRELFRTGNDAEVEGGFFNPQNDEFLIENRSESALLAADGQHGAVALTYGDTVAIRGAAPLNVVARTH